MRDRMAWSRANADRVVKAGRHKFFSGSGVIPVALSDLQPRVPADVGSLESMVDAAGRRVRLTRRRFTAAFLH